MKFIKTTIALVLATVSSLAVATSFTVDAKQNSTSGGTGLNTFALLAGQQFTVSVDQNDLWNAGAIPRWSNANGLTGSLNYATGSTDPEVPHYANGTQIGKSFGNYSQNGLTAAYGTLVGQIGSSSFFAIGTSYSGTASSAGTLKLFYFDSNNIDNSGSIVANVTAVPEPESYAMLLAGLGLMGAIARRRKPAA